MLLFTMTMLTMGIAEQQSQDQSVVKEESLSDPASDDSKTSDTPAKNSDDSKNSTNDKPSDEKSATSSDALKDDASTDSKEKKESKDDDRSKDSNTEKDQGKSKDSDNVKDSSEDLKQSVDSKKSDDKTTDIPANITSTPVCLNQAIKWCEYSIDKAKKEPNSLNGKYKLMFDNKIDYAEANLKYLKGLQQLSKEDQRGYKTQYRSCARSAAAAEVKAKLSLVYSNKKISQD